MFTKILQIIYLYPLTFYIFLVHIVNMTYSVQDSTWYSEIEFMKHQNFTLAI